jgi:hypothetical protein
MSSAGDAWAAHQASTERLCRLASCADLPQGSVHMDDALALLCGQPAHPVVAELAESWGLDGLAERLLAYCRALPAVRRGELRATRLARRLDGAVWEMGRDRRLVLGTHAVERAAVQQHLAESPVIVARRDQLAATAESSRLNGAAPYRSAFKSRQVAVCVVGIDGR